MSTECSREDIEANYKARPEEWVNAYMCLDDGARTFMLEPEETRRIMEIEAEYNPYSSHSKKVQNHFTLLGYIGQITHLTADNIDAISYDTRKVTVFPLRPDGTPLFAKQ